MCQSVAPLSMSQAISFFLVLGLFSSDMDDANAILSKIFWKLFQSLVLPKFLYHYGDFAIHKATLLGFK